MGVGLALGAAASAASLAGSINQAVSGPNTPPQPAPGSPAGGGYQPAFQSQLDQFTMPNFQQLYNLGTTDTNIPYLQSATNALIGSPYTNPYQVAANQAGAMAPRIAQMQMGGAQGLYGGANQILGQAFDPRQSLYSRTAQQLMDQINAGNAASDVSGPYAAGLSADRMANFNIDWQNAQLQREMQGLRGAGLGFAGASDLSQLAQQSTLQGGQIPYQSYNQILNNNIGALNQQTASLQNVMQLPQQSFNDILSYLARGQSGAANAISAFGAQQQNANLGFQQQQQIGQNLAGSLANPALASGLNQLFSPNQNQGFQPPPGTGGQTPFDFSTGQFQGSA